MEIKPFKAFRFDPQVVGDVGSCISPPYDVISAQQQQQLYDKNPYNIVRIIKGKTSDSDNDSDNQYTRAADYLNKWIEQGALKQDSEEAIYGYVQDFNQPGRHIQRFSFIALTKLEPFGPVVRPHEKVLENPIIDRLNLSRATSAKFGLVFVMYEDKELVAEKIIEKAMQNQPLIDFVDDQKVQHRLLAINDTADIDTITKMITDKNCIIADGHHRYTTALAYAKENPGVKYQMLAFANTSHEGLIVLATHRLVANLDHYDFAKLLADLKENFEIMEYSFDSPQTKADAKTEMLAAMKQQLDLDKNAYGIYGRGGAFHLAVLKDRSAMTPVAPDKSEPWRSLDVAVLHKLILESSLGIDEEKQAGGGYIEYVKDVPIAVDDSIARVDAGRKQVAFFMNPPKMNQIQQVADAGERMPQKSTYFYPKVYTGLTINKL